MNLSRAFSSPLACFRLTRCRPPSPAAGREGTPGAASPRHPDEASPLISAQKGPFIEAATASFPSAVTEEFIVHVYFKASAGEARERPFASAPRRDGPRWPGAMANLPRTALPGIGRCRVLRASLPLPQGRPLIPPVASCISWKPFSLTSAAITSCPCQVVSLTVPDFLQSSLACPDRPCHPGCLSRRQDVP